MNKVKSKSAAQIIDHERDCLAIEYKWLAELPPLTAQNVADRLCQLNRIMNRHAMIADTCLRFGDDRANEHAREIIAIGNDAESCRKQFRLDARKTDLNFSFGKAAIYAYLATSELPKKFTQNCQILCDDRKIDLECYVGMDSLVAVAICVATSNSSITSEGASDS